MKRLDVLRIVDDAVQAAYAAGAAGPDEDVAIDPYVDRILALADRTWSGEAQAAFDQALTTAGDRDAMPGPDFWVARAAAAAAIESAKQARIGNLIAWKQMQLGRESRGIDGSVSAGDYIDEQIEEGLGIA